MPNLVTHELHSFTVEISGDESSGETIVDIDKLPWRESDRAEASVLAITQEDPSDTGPEFFWVGIDVETGLPIGVAGESRAVAGFRPVQRRLAPALAMTATRGGVLVNGVPALPLSILSTRDALVLAPGVHTYVTERIRPHVGKPTADMIGCRCPFCRIEITQDTRVVTCRCGVPYHWETEESHPEVEEADRLNCFEKVRACLSCSRPLTLEESLAWDPAAL